MWLKYLIASSILYVKYTDMVVNVNIVNLDIFPLISWSNIVSINKLTLMLENISQYDVTLRRSIPIKTIKSVLKVSTYIITSITAHPIGLTLILAIMSVSNFKAVVIILV